jgi:hypothetical protein
MEDSINKEAITTNIKEESNSKKTTMISDLRDSRVGNKISKSFIEREANYLKNPNDYHHHAAQVY